MNRSERTESAAQTDQKVLRHEVPSAMVKVSVLKLRDTFHEIIKNTNEKLIEKGADPQSLPSPFIVSFIIKYSKELETGLYIIEEVSVPAYNMTFPRSSLIDIFDGIPCCNSYYNINCFDLVRFSSEKPCGVIVQKTP